MKWIFHIVAGIICFSCFLLPKHVVSQLSGNYTIGGIDADYATFEQAVSDLNAIGITSHVVFNVRSGVYQEQIKINAVAGSGPGATITFQSETGNPQDAVLNHFHDSFGDAFNHTIYLNGTSHIAFRGLTISSLPEPYSSSTESRVVRISNGCEYVVFQNNILSAPSGAMYSNPLMLLEGLAVGVHHISVLNNRIIGGNIAIDVIGSTGSAFLTYAIQLNGNHCEGQRNKGFNLTKCRNVVIKNNRVVEGMNYEGSAVPAAIYLTNMSDTVQVSGNLIVPWNEGYGIYLAGITRGIDHFKLVVNNMISAREELEDPTLEAMAIDDCCPLLVAYNSISMVDGFSLRSLGTDTIDIFNNQFALYGNGACIYRGSATGAVLSSDHNNFFAQGNALVTLGAATYSTTMAYFAATGNDASSFSVDPLFLNDSTLVPTNPAVFNLGMPLSDVVDDFYGTMRSASSPDPGAFEGEVMPNDAGVVFSNLQTEFPCPGSNLPVFVTIKNFGTQPLTSAIISIGYNGVVFSETNWSGVLNPLEEESNILIGNFNAANYQDSLIQIWVHSPNGFIDGLALNDTLSTIVIPRMSGTYAIDNTAGDFTDITAATSALMYHGVCGPVTFLISPGNYYDRFVLGQIEGTSSVNNVVFQSSTLDSSDVVISFLSFATPEYSLINLDETDYVVFDHLTLRSTGSGYNGIVRLRGGSDYNVWRNCVFLNEAPAQATPDNLFAYLDTETKNNNLIENNRFVGGAQQIDLSGSNSLLSQNNTIRGNYFEGGFKAIVLNYQQSPIIEGNRCFREVEIQNCNNGIRIIGNNMDYEGTAAPLKVTSCYNNTSGVNLIANNFLKSNSSALFLSGCENMNVYHNSMYGGGVYLGLNMVDLNIYNNIVSLTDCWPFISLAASDYLDEMSCDYNAYYCPDPDIAFDLDGAQVELTEWITDLGLDLHSIVADPLFVSTDDLHVAGSLALYQAGIAAPLVPYDIDNEPRNPVEPSIGADEYYIDPMSITDIELVRVVSPDTLICTPTDSVTILVANHSVFPINSFVMEWRVAGMVQDIVNFDGTIDPGDSVEVTIANYPFTQNTLYHLDFTVSNPNDVYDNFPANNYIDFTYSQTNSVDIRQYREVNCDESVELYLESLPDHEILWSTGSTARKITVNPPGTYTVQVTNEAGCVVNDTITID